MKLAAFFLASFVTTTAFAQPASIAAQEIARARLLLHSSQLSDKAWGAYFAGRLASPDLAPDLLAQFQSAAAFTDPSHSNEHSMFTAALFDAAIESNLQVPPADLTPFETSWTEPVLVLLALSRDRNRQDALLRFSGAPYDAAWLAANNLLFGMKSRKWYADTLGSVAITHHFAVVDPGAAPPEQTGVGGGACGDSLIVAPDSFPPITFYSFEGRPQPGLVLIAPGPENVYYRRTTIQPGKQGGFGSCFSVDRPLTRIEYLAALANLPGKQVIGLFQRDTVISYRGDAAFQLEVQQKLQAQEQEIRTLLQTIQQREHLTAAGAALRIQPDVIDHRHDRTSPLPFVPPRDIH